MWYDTDTDINTDKSDMYRYISDLSVPSVVFRILCGHVRAFIDLLLLGGSFLRVRIDIPIFRYFDAACQRVR